MIIYKATNKINNKVYVGQSIKTLEHRKKQHERSCNYRDDMAICRAIKKYGKDNFDWEVIDTADTLEELNEKESFWIENLDSITTSGHGYNIKGGGSQPYLTEETKRKIGEAQKGDKNHQYGIKGYDCKHTKPVKNITDNICYSGSTECGEKENISFKLVSAICNGDKGSYKGKIYRFIDENGGIIPPKNNTKAKTKRGIINLTTNETYECITDVANLYNDSNLSRQLKKYGGYCLWKGFKWKYEDIEIDIDDIPDKNYRKDAIKIINLDTKEIFNCIEDVDRCMNLARLLKKGGGICIWKNQKWQYYEQYINNI